MDPYQPDQSGVTDHYSGEHRWWHSLLWVLGGRIAGESSFRRTTLGRLLAVVIGIGIVVLILLLAREALTDPRNTPLPNGPSGN